MRSAIAHTDLAVIRAKHGDLDQAVHHGLAAFGYDRKTEASLLSHAVDLDRILIERYPRAADRRLPRSVHEGAGKPAATGALVRIERKPHGDALAARCAVLITGPDEAAGGRA